MNKTIILTFVFALLCVGVAFGVECSTTPIDGCSVTADTTFDFGTYYFNSTIDINADDIILDCNEATIINDGKVNNFGIFSNNHNITIKNCNMDGRGEIGNWTDTGNWTDKGSNIWKFVNNPIIYRLFLNNSEFNGMSQSNTTQNESNRWFYNSTAGFTVYALENPASHYSSMKRIFTTNSIKLQSIKNATLINLNLTGNIQSILIAGSSNVTVHSSNIGMWSVTAIRITAQSTTKSENNLFYNNTFDSGHNFQNTWNEDGLDDGINFADGVWNNTVRNSTFINWGHNAFYISAGTTLCSKYNKFYDNTVFGDGTTYMRGFGIDGGDNCAEFNEIYDVVITDTTVRNQINGNDNHIWNITIDTITNSPRDTSIWGTGQGIHVEDYCGYCVAYNNTFENITFNNIDEACIHIGANATSNTFKNMYYNNCGINSQYTQFQDKDIVFLITGSSSSLTNSSFIDNLALDGIIEYRLRDDAGVTQTIVINETSTVRHKVTLDNSGNISFIYNGRKDFRVENNTITINNMVAPYNDIYNQTGSVLIASDQTTYTLTISPNVEIRVGDYFTALNNATLARNKVVAAIMDTISFLPVMIIVLIGGIILTLFIFRNKIELGDITAITDSETGLQPIILVLIAFGILVVIAILILNNIPT